MHATGANITRQKSLPSAWQLSPPSSFSSFVFVSDERIAEMFEDTEQRQAIEDEVADTLLFLLRFADLNEIDLPAALSSKLKRNGERYPVDASSNEYRKANHHE